MELVNVNLFAEGSYDGYHSRREYEDNLWIKKSSYEKLINVFPEKILCGDVMGEVSVQDSSYTDDYYAKLADAPYDGDYLKSALRDLYEANGLDWIEEQKEINEYLSHLDLYEDVTVSVPHDRVEELLAFAKLLQKY